MLRIILTVSPGRCHISLQLIVRKVLTVSHRFGLESIAIPAGLRQYAACCSGSKRRAIRNSYDDFHFEKNSAGSRVPDHVGDPWDDSTSRLCPGLERDHAGYRLGPASVSAGAVRRDYATGGVRSCERHPEGLQAVFGHRQRTGRRIGGGGGRGGRAHRVEGLLPGERGKFGCGAGRFAGDDPGRACEEFRHHSGGSGGRGGNGGAE
jgi:hypothetical protein